jgi:type I restriction enzyme S subunit
MNISQLPEGWVEKKLGDVCEKVEYGSSVKSKPEGKIPVLRMGNVQNGSIDWSNLVYSTDKEEIDKYLLKYNDVLFNRTNSDEHVGKTAIYKGERPAIFAGYLIRIIRKEDLIDADFLNYYLNSHTIREYGKSIMSRSVNQANINGTKLKDYPIILPPLSEQKRIVAIVGQAFEGIDRAIVNTQKNLTNTRELFESYLNAIFTQKGDGWIEKNLGDICDLISGQHIDAKDYNTDSKGIAYLTGPSDFGITHPIISKWTEVPKRTALRNDILITVKGSGVGKINLLNSDEVAISRQLMAVRSKGQNIWFIYAFLSLQYSYFQALANGAAIPGISRSDVLCLKLPVPSLDVQKAVVTDIDQHHSATQRLEAIYQQKLAALNELKQSILQKAFTGELTCRHHQPGNKSR